MVILRCDERGASFKIMNEKAALSWGVTRQIVLALACCIVFPAAAQAGESVLYSVRTSEEHSGIPIYKTQVSKTEIFAVDPETGNQRLVFSDANAHFFLRGTIFAAGGKIFAEGIEPVRSAAGTPRFDPGAPAAVYELSTDGSGQARKLFDVQRGEQGADCSNLTFLNSSGSEFGNIANIGGTFYLMVCETATGKLLRKSEFKYGSEERRGWRFGSVARIGWLPDDSRIFFTIDLAGDRPEAWWTTPGSPVGTYVLEENADSAQRLAPEAALHPKIAGMQPSNDSPAMLIGVLPDGGYLFQDYEADSHGAGGACLYDLDLARETQKIFPLHQDGDPGSFHLSGSGNRLVLMATQRNYQKQPTFSAIQNLSLWVIDLDSGKEWKLVALPPHDVVHGTDGPWVNLIGWLDKQ
jgi:hypothetical protein